MVRQWYKNGEALLGEIAAYEPAEKELAFWYIGQEGFIFKRNVTICIDPVLSELREENGDVISVHYPAPFAPEQLQADYILCTHGHVDHMYVPMLARAVKANKHVKLIVPGGCISMLTEAGIGRERIIEAEDGKTISLEGLVVRPVSAAHPEHREDEQGRDMALCYDLEMDGISVLHMGDTYMTDRLMTSLEALPRPDLFFAPINGGDYFRTAQGLIGNLSGPEAAILAARLKADLAVPCHFDLIPGNTAEPYDFIQRLWEENPAAKWKIPALGEQVLYKKQEVDQHI